MPPLSTQEQDDQQCNDETENCSTFGQSSTQQQVGLDLAGSLGLAGNSLGCLAGCNADANAAANTSQPGKTQTINFYEIGAKLPQVEARQDFYLVDLPGYGYAKTGAKRRKVWSKFINEYLLSSPRIQFVCQLIDVRHEPMASDVEMFSWLVKNNLPVLVIATKADKVGKNAVAKNVAAIKRGLGIPDLDVLPYSSLKNQGRQELLQVIADCLGEAEE